ncbi:hypothetical protein NA57DRAFT_61322 [Rhizodiscina lignyota]|uniref:Zn(2)-C6 fungal-type domain-containing protein n=1 Tax=Rhizodiscina lignyota TaxID=1504668 RepID=A0A9P4I8B8_9PEZI|nr:hypothetical protein NA57DRAFT_61322 [Rhizodiscina lignyota]
MKSTTPQRGFSYFKVSQGQDFRIAHLDEYGNPARQRRKHSKSKAGCSSCKARKIKCDEARPSCTQCIVKSRICSLMQLPRPQQCTNDLSPMQGTNTTPTERILSIPLASEMSLIPSSLPWQASSSRVNLLEMQLFHHFITYTADTMIFGSCFWTSKVVPLALHSDFLMHAALAIAASHLQYLQPHERKYQQLELHHISVALHGFRNALSGPITAATANGLISGAILLFHNSWSSTDFRNNNADGGLYFQGDSLFPLAAGLARLVWETRYLRDPSFFEPIVAYGPAASVMGHVEQTGLPSQLELFLRGCYNSLRSQGAAPEDDAVYMSAAKRLIPALAILKLDLTGHDMVNVKSDVARWLFTWPAKSEHALRKLIKSNYDAAQILLLYYYTAVLKLLPEKCWWARKRSKFFCELILRQLDGKPESSIQWALDLHKAAENVNSDHMD